jgi:hypothetical protein
MMSNEFIPKAGALRVRDGEGDWLKVNVEDRFYLLLVMVATEMWDDKLQQWIPTPASDEQEETEPTIKEGTPSDWADPDWNFNKGADRYHSHPHEWKKYVSNEFQEMWPMLSPGIKQALARQAQEIAANEDWE